MSNESNSNTINSLVKKILTKQVYRRYSIVLTMQPFFYPDRANHIQYGREGLELAYRKLNFMSNYWNNYAEETARELKKENPDWDEESLIYETMECVEMELMEKLPFVERHLRKFLKEKITCESKNLSNEKE